MLGSVITISTMAAAALGNTFSDIMGIGSAWYVESLATKVGIKPPNLSPIQLTMNISRWAANMVCILKPASGGYFNMHHVKYLVNNFHVS